MDRNDAEKLMLIYSKVGDLLNSADPILRNIPDKGHRESLLKGLGGLLTDLWLKLQRPIVKEYPDLDPDKGSDWLKQLKSKRPSGKV